MNRPTILVATVLLLGIGICLNSCGPQVKPKSASLVLTYSAKGVLLCEVNGKPITVVIDELRNLYRLNGQKMRLNLFLHEDVEISHISRFMPVIANVGFTNVHMYLFDRNKSGMNEISFGKKLPFTFEP